MAEEKNKIWAVIAYFFGVIGILAYFIKKDDPYVRFHAMQSLLVSIVFMVIGTVTLGIGYIIYFFLWLFLMWKAWSGEKYMLPVLGQYADQWSK